MRKVQNIFSPKASRVLRVLLTHPYKGWTIERLSREAKTSLGYTHAVVTSLIDRGYVYRDDSYRVRAYDPVKLIRRWAAYHNYVSVNTFLRYHTFERNIDVFLLSLRDTEDPEYALTALAGAHIVAPYVRPTTVHFYTRRRENAKTWVRLLDLRPVETGGNVSIVLPYDEGVFYGARKISGAKVVGNVQLYLDLYNYPARGEDAAEAVLKTLEKEWGPQKNLLPTQLP